MQVRIRLIGIIGVALKTHALITSDGAGDVSDGGPLVEATCELLRRSLSGGVSAGRLLPTEVLALTHTIDTLTYTVVA
jgi:hypothetical protein